MTFAKGKILNYINENYPQFSDLFEEIYIHGKKNYWDDLAVEIEAYCEKQAIEYTNFFGHEKLVAKKRGLSSKAKVKK